MAKNKKIQILRTDSDLIDALHRNVELLKEYHVKAFINGDPKYLGEVAGKLRLLIYRSDTCKPLLINLMEKFGVKIQLNLLGPGNRNANIDDYFNSTCGAFRSSKTDKLIEITPMQIVSTWAQQMGASHEDDSLDENFVELISQGVFINGKQIAIDELRRASDFILSIANEFFKVMKR